MLCISDGCTCTCRFLCVVFICATFELLCLYIISAHFSSTPDLATLVQCDYIHFVSSQYASAHSFFLSFPQLCYLPLEQCMCGGEGGMVHPSFGIFCATIGHSMCVFEGIADAMACYKSFMEPEKHLAHEEAPARYETQTNWRSSLIWFEFDTKRTRPVAICYTHSHATLFMDM